MSGWFETALAWIVGAMAAWGYPLLIVLTTLESVFIVGAFVPGEVIIATAAFAATQRAGTLNPFAIWVCAVAGAMIGTNISYRIGVRGGRALLERVGPRFGISASRIEAAEEYFERHGSHTVFLARFIAVFKSVTPVIAGASRMRLRTFETYAFAGAAVHATLLVAIGWFLGANFRTGLKVLSAFGWGGFVVAIAVMAGLAWFRRRYTNRRIAELEAEWEREHPGESRGPQG